jgi:hypothetical protein
VIIERLKIRLNGSAIKSGHSRSNLVEILFKPVALDRLQYLVWTKVQKLLKNLFLSVETGFILTCSSTQNVKF